MTTRGDVRENTQAGTAYLLLVLGELEVVEYFCALLHTQCHLVRVRRYVGVLLREKQEKKSRYTLVLKVFSKTIGPALPQSQLTTNDWPRSQLSERRRPKEKVLLQLSKILAHNVQGKGSNY